MSSATNLNVNVISNPQIVEYGKFVRIDGDTRFPYISVTHYHYPDQSQAFPNNIGVPPITSVDVYPKYAVLTYDVNSPGAGGFDYITSASGVMNYGYSSFLAVSATTISGITAQYSTVNNLTGVTLPAGFTFNAPIQAISVSSGGAILYKND